MEAAHELACPECDLMVALDPLESGQRADCPRCGQLLTVFEHDAMTRGLAYAVAAAIRAEPSTPSCRPRARRATSSRCPTTSKRN